MFAFPVALVRFSKNVKCGWNLIDGRSWARERELIWGGGRKCTAPWQGVHRKYDANSRQIRQNIRQTQNDDYDDYRILSLLLITFAQLVTCRTNSGALAQWRKHHGANLSLRAGNGFAKSQKQKQRPSSEFLKVKIFWVELDWPHNTISTTPVHNRRIQQRLNTNMNSSSIWQHYCKIHKIKIRKCWGRT